MQTKIGGTWLEIVAGDITQLEIDAIVNAANDHLWMGGGVAGAIKRVGGQVIEDEARAQGPIALGDAVSTTGGALKARWVIHAAVMSQDLKTSATIIGDATKRSLEVAEMLGARSVALPAFGTGVGGFPLYACADIMVAKAREHLVEHPRSGLRRVAFSAFDEVAKAAFTNALAGLSRFTGQPHRRVSAGSPASHTGESQPVHRPAALTRIGRFTG
jgi:O-acetyl-ADP-ribose deacetylase (regulator of RNase III)